MSQASPGMASHTTMTSRDLLDDGVSIHSFETILLSYSEATLPSYTPPPVPASSRSQFAATSSSQTRASRPPPVPKPQILSISQSNLPLRFTGPQSHPWSPKIVYPASSTRNQRHAGELNNFFRGRRPTTEALAHGDTSEIPIFGRRRSPPPRTTSGRSFDEEVRMRELDELTRAISRGNHTRREYPPAVPQIPGSLRRESRLLGEEWDNLAVEVQREEIVIRISEFESQFEERRQLPYITTNSLRQDIASLRTILSTRRDDVSLILAGQIARLRELKQAGTRVSHVQKDQIKNDMVAMKAEITFLEQRAADLEKLGRTVEEDDIRRATGDAALEDDSKNWDLWFEASGHR